MPALAHLNRTDSNPSGRISAYVPVIHGAACSQDPQPLGISSLRRLQFLAGLHHLDHCSQPNKEHEMVIYSNQKIAGSIRLTCRIYHDAAAPFLLLASNQPPLNVPPHCAQGRVGKGESPVFP